MRPVAIRLLLLSLPFLHLPNPATARDGVLVGKFEWSVSAKAFEPAANPALVIAGKRVSRAKHVWAQFGGSVSFQCWLKGGKLYAINPVISETKPRYTPINWGNLQGISQFANISFFDFKVAAADIKEGRFDITTGHSRDGCFTIKWKGSFRKTGAKLTYKINPGGGVNPLTVPPQTIDLDDAMHDELVGQTQICCCGWELEDEIAKETDRIDREFDPIEGFDPEAYGRLDDATTEQALQMIGVDWTASNVGSPNPKSAGDKNTAWEGIHLLKQCTYVPVRVITSSGGFETKLKAQGPIPPGSKTLKPVEQKF